ncbi:MAG: MerR family transcriptional regulator [Phototrophicaceae bacterium]
MTMTIGEVAKIAGVATSTLRYYEDIGLISPPIRVNKQRRYDENILPILAVIQLAKDSQFTLDEIKELLYDFPDDVPLAHRWQIIAERKIDEIERVIRQAQETKALLHESLTCQYLHFELNDAL